MENEIVREALVLAQHAEARAENTNYSMAHLLRQCAAAIRALAKLVPQPL